MTRRVRERPAPTVWNATSYHDTGGPLLLDTHVWIWRVADDDARVAPAATGLLDRVGADGSLIVSDISYWEVAVKSAKGTLRLAMDWALWLQRAEQAPGIRFHPLTREVLLQSTRLAGTPHNDPADRILMATAQLLCVPLVTADRQIIAYARKHAGLQVIDVRR
ncbi:MAG: type II toxin-antitoxin system VapC family toxin [Gemmatimonadaceae bacterium]|nr:type II toxin-antitoxin system VapC family toxin [Gemmatimonadaceae bacterium]